MRRWSLGQLTVIGTRPSELVEIAAQAGYDAVDPLVGVARDSRAKVVPLAKGDLDTQKMAQALQATGIAFNTADGFFVSALTDLDAMRRMVDLCAELGARNVNAIFFDEDRARGVGNLAALDVMARDAGLAVLLEPMPYSTVIDAQSAVDIIRQIGSDNIKLMFDPLHLSQWGGTPAEVRSFGSWIGGAQLNDAPAHVTVEEYRRMAGEERLVPGEGELPLVDYLAALPPDLTCTIEAPRLDEPDLVARARRSLDAGRAIDPAS